MKYLPHVSGSSRAGPEPRARDGGRGRGDAETVQYSSVQCSYTQENCYTSIILDMEKEEKNRQATPEHNYKLQ